MKNALEQDEQRIAQDLAALGRKLEAGDSSQMLVWIIPEGLACAHRPLRHDRLYGGSGRNIAAEAAPLVIDWAKRVRELGIRSILCLMHDKELAYYSCLDLGASDLIDFYRKQGFEVRRVPWEDPHHSATARKEIEKKRAEICVLALKVYDQLPKPVLLHCSAGIDRSSPVAAYIRSKRPTRPVV